MSFLLRSFVCWLVLGVPVAEARLTDPIRIDGAYSYDALNREISRTYSEPADAALARQIQTVDTRYDGNNNVTAITEAFDDGHTQTTTHRYDDFDRVRETTDPFGRRLIFGYDLNGNRNLLIDPDDISTTYTFDALNRLATVTSAQGTTVYTYDRSSLIDTVAYPNNTGTAYTYDAARRVQTITHTLGAAGIISRFAYAYDANGNRTEQIEENGGAAEATTYAYDALDRLEVVTYPDNITTYTYDAAYNRATETVTRLDGTTTLTNLDYVYNARNQLTGIDDLETPAESVSYTYDPNGNQVAKTAGGVTTDFIYDARDNLRKVTVGGSTVGQFLYDDGGLRIEKQGDRGTERYTYDDLAVITQSDATNTTLAKYDYGPDRLLALEHTTEGTQFYLTDALDSVTNLTRSDGGVQARYQYDAFGNYRSQSGSSFNRFGFTGHEHDEETGLIYAKARFYDPETGRFLSHDAFEGENDNPPSLHKYLYAYQNPTVYVDPDGNETVAEIIGIDDNSIQQNIDAGNDGRLDAVKHAGKATSYAIWNAFTFGFLERQDDRRFKFDRRSISATEFHGGTVSDAGISTIGMLAGGGVASHTTRFLGSSSGSKLIGAGFGSAVDDLTIQSGQVITGTVTDGRLGQDRLDLASTAQSAALGTAMSKLSLSFTRKSQIASESPASVQSKLNELSATADAELGAPIIRTRVAPQSGGPGSSPTALADAELGVRVDGLPSNYYGRNVRSGPGQTVTKKSPKALPAPKTRGNSNAAPENGAIYVDSKGNAIVTPPGGRITGSPDGRFIQARDANGNVTGVRKDGGHNPANHPDPRAQQPHGHIPGATNPDGTPWLPINQ